VGKRDQLKIISMWKEIQWTELKDRHLEGFSDMGKVCIRFNTELLATGIYTWTQQLEKWVPEAEEKLKPEDAKIQAEILLSLIRAARLLEVG
jgi:hypothetical protein